MPSYDPEAIASHYLATLNKGDLDEALSLFSDDASLEDPYGTPALEGKENFAAVFERVLGQGLKIEDIAPFHCAGDTVAMTYKIVLPSIQFKTISLMRLNDEGKIVNFRAYWSKANFIGD